MKGFLAILILSVIICVVSAASHQHHEKKHHVAKKHHSLGKRHHLKRDSGECGCKICEKPCEVGCFVRPVTDNDDNIDGPDAVKRIFGKKSHHSKRDDSPTEQTTENGLGESEGVSSPYDAIDDNCCICECDETSTGPTDSTEPTDSTVDDRKRSKHFAKKHHKNTKKHHHHDAKSHN